jgi:hypothetical protein
MSQFTPKAGQQVRITGNYLTPIEGTVRFCNSEVLIVATSASTSLKLARTCHQTGWHYRNLPVTIAPIAGSAPAKPFLVRAQAVLARAKRTLK